jgi:hypothetical protein
MIYNIFFSPLHPLSKGGRGDGEGLGVRVLCQTDLDSLYIPKGKKKNHKFNPIDVQLI